MATDTKLTRAASLLGRRGGLTTAERLTPEQRRANAIKAVRTRWARQRDSEAIPSTGEANVNNQPTTGEQPGTKPQRGPAQDSPLETALPPTVSQEESVTVSLSNTSTEIA
jgi:hypothetical protein